MTVHRCATALAALALVAAPALAETVAWDNSDLTFLLVPEAPYSLGGPVPFSWYDAKDLFVMSSPAANAAGTGTGPSLHYRADRQHFTSSQDTWDTFNGAAIEKSLAPGYGPVLGGNYQALREFSLGDSVDPTDFAPINDPSSALGPVVLNGDSVSGQVPLLGDEAIIGFRIAEGPDFRYGFVRMTWFENVPYPISASAPVIPNPPNTISLYLPTAWGYETELNTPVLIQIPAPGAALIPVAASVILVRKRTRDHSSV